MIETVATPYGPVAFMRINGTLYPANLLNDLAGNDVLGTVEQNPDPFTLLGRLKTVADLLSQLLQQGGTGTGTGGGGNGGGGGTGPSMDFSKPENSQFLGG